LWQQNWTSQFSAAALQEPPQQSLPLEAARALL
jgi:hypothetical protein